MHSQLHVIFHNFQLRFATEPDGNTERMGFLPPLPENSTTQIPFRPCFIRIPTPSDTNKDSIRIELGMSISSSERNFNRTNLNIIQEISFITFKLGGG